MTEAERFRAVTGHFETAIGLASPQLEAYLAGLDSDVRESVARLLEADAIATGVFGGEAGGATLLAADLAIEPIPERIGPFRIGEVLGEGAMGIVYEAEQDHPRRQVALKVLRPWMRTAFALELFKFEAQALGQVEHPCIPRVWQAGEHDGTAWLAMELVRGVPLWTWSLGAGRNARIAMLAEIADAAHAAHCAGLVHRDLKPGNILVRDERPVLLDFGVAMPLKAHTTSIVGTPAYMAPEQRDGGAVGPAADLYAIGVFGHELLTGELPPRVTAPGIPDAEAVLARSRAARPEDRHPSGAALASDLRAGLEHRSLPWRHGRGRRVALWCRRHAGLLGAIGVAFALPVAGYTGHRAQVAAVAEAREVQALRVMEGLRPSLDQAAASDDWDGVERLYQGLIASSDFVGTQAQVRAALGQADRLDRHGRSGALDVLAAAWVRTSRPEDLGDLRVALGRRFAHASRWEALWVLLQGAAPSTREALHDELNQAAVALRRFEDGPENGITQQLARAERLGIQGPAGQFVQLDGQRQLLHLRGEQGRLGDRPLGVDRDRWPEPEAMLVHQGVLWMALGEGDRPAELVRLTDAGLETFAELPVGQVSSLVRHDGHFVVGTGYPRRGIHHVGMDGVVESIGLGHDVSSLLSTDLDGDGEAELVRGLGAWGGYRVETGIHTLPVGEVSGLAVAQGRHGPVLVVAESDRTENRRYFGENRPYGPSPGLYLYEGATPIGYLPVPAADRDAGPELGVGSPRIADLDGDGRPDLVVNLDQIEIDGEMHTWIVADLLGEQRSLVVNRMRTLQVLDTDGDGDDELLVSSGGELWIVGSGSGSLEPLATSGEERWETLPAGTEVAVLTGWERSRELASLGLTRPAATALSSMCELATAAAVRSTCHHRAAQLFVAVEDPEKAAEHLARALAASPDAETRVALVNARLQALDAAGALAVMDDQPAWLAASTIPFVDWLEDPTLAAWRLAADGVWSRPGGRFQLEAFNDQRILAEREVEVVGSWIDAKLQLELSTLELGAGLAVELVDAEGTAVFTLGFEGQGGGGTTRVHQRCGASSLESMAVRRFAPGASLLLQGSVSPLGLRCRNLLAGEGRWMQLPATPIPPGVYTLRIRAFGDALYEPPTVVRAVLLGLETRGLRPLPLEHTSASAARGALLDGTLAPGLPDLPRALASQDPVLLRRAVRQLTAPEGLQELRWWLRLRPREIAPVAAQLLGPAFAAQYARAWRVGMVDRPLDPDVESAGLWAPLEALDPASEAGARLLRYRASVLERRGRTAEAAAIRKQLGP